VQAKRIKWKELNWEAEQYNLVFLDESGVNIDMTRRYGRAIGKARVHCSAPLNTPMSQTVLASVRLNGQITYTMYSGGTTGERFLDYLKNVLIPTLHRGDIVVMDNMRSHHVKGVKEALRAAGVIPLYLPLHSPDLNPIEMLWSKMKAILRKWGCRLLRFCRRWSKRRLLLFHPMTVYSTSHKSGHSFTTGV
jgi:transposase